MDTHSYGGAGGGGRGGASSPGRASMVSSITAILPALLVISLVGGLLMLAFWFFTTEVVAMKVSSGQWWFFLAATAFLIFGASTFVLRSMVHRRVKVGFMAIAAIMTIILVVLGVQHQPLATHNLQGKIGLVPAFSADDGHPVEEIDFSDLALDSPVVNHERFLPAPFDQGQCGSCWAVASGASLSARYNKFLSDNDEVSGVDSFKNCTPLGVEMKDWHFSPQYILDEDEGRGDGFSCSSGPTYGKCNGNSQIAGFEIAEAGVPHIGCVPYYAQDTNACKTDCGSPEDRSYLNCPGGNVSTQCLKPRGTNWTACGNGDELVKDVETYDVKHVLGEAAMMKDVAEFGPILCGINFYKKSNGANAAWTLSDQSSLWGKYADLVTKGYVVRPDFDGQEYTKSFDGGGHAVVVYGFGEHEGVKYWNIMNSWGSQWGANGKTKIERGVDAWNIESLCASAKVREYSGS